VTSAALGLVLASAAVHALWNTLLADASDTHASTAVALVASALVAVPVAAVTWDVDGAATPFVLASAALELVYFALLATAYSRADLTFVYPVARGSAPVLVLIVSVAFLGAAVGVLQALGVLAVVAGVLLVRGVGRVDDPVALGLALGVGTCIAGYTLIDDRGLRHAAALPYFACVAVLMALPYAAVVWARAGGAAVRAAVSWRALVMGVGMFIAYGLTLLALERAEAAPVAALRETSVVMAAIAAAVAGRERAAAGRIAGAAVVVAGVAAIALG
jgi:drug/metabolite transporter (DMT)-like permease